MQSLQGPQERLLQPLTEPTGDVKGRPLKILLVDDNPVNRKVAKRMLQNLGHEVEVAIDGECAVNAVSRADFDLVFMDCQMPVMDGFVATAQIRQLEGPRARVPIVAMTANAMQGDRERCLSEGMDDYISKPVRRDALVEILERFKPGAAQLAG